MMVCRTTKRERKQEEEGKQKKDERERERDEDRMKSKEKRHRWKFDSGSMILDCVFLELLSECVVRSLPLNPSALCHHFDSFLTAFFCCVVGFFTLLFVPYRF